MGDLGDLGDMGDFEGVDFDRLESELMILLAQGNPEKAAIPDDWKSVNQAAIDSDKVSW